MKSLSAWSVDREDAQKQQISASLERDAALERFSGEIADMSDVLIKTLSLYEVAESQRRQHESIKRWLSQQGDMVRTSIESQTRKLKSSLVSALTSAVGPLLKDVIEKRAVDDFCGVLEMAAGKSLFENSVVSVPPRLHDALVEELQKRGLKVRVEPVDGQEIAIEANDTRVESRIASAVDELNGVLEQ